MGIFKGKKTLPDQVSCETCGCLIMTKNAYCTITVFYKEDWKTNAYWKHLENKAVPTTYETKFEKVFYCKVHTPRE